MASSSKFPWTPVVAGILILLGVAGVYYAQADRLAWDPAHLLQLHAKPQPVPDLTFIDGDAHGLKLSEFRGKVVLLNLWATWCAPCRKEMPALDRLERKLGSRDFQVLALSIDNRGAPAVKRYFETIGIRSLGVYADPSAQAADKLRALGVPTTLLIDRRGLEIGRRTGPAAWDSPPAEALIERYVKR